MTTLWTIEIAGSEVITTLEAKRVAFPTTGEYPFLIGDAEALEQIYEAAQFSEQDPGDIIRRSLEVDVTQWIAERRAEADEYAFSVEETLGAWTGEASEKGSISLHKDVLSGEIKSEVYVGLAAIAEPWQLPAVLKYGAWNDCPAAEVHCAFHRKWQAEFGAQIAGMSGDVIECVVSNPPRSREAAVELAWQQYWYCTDIVEQGCESVSNLAATLLNALYWYFWWD